MLNENPVATIFRFTVYTFLILTFTALLPSLVEGVHVAIFDENGPVEWMQIAILLGASMVFLACAFQTPRRRELFLILMCGPVFAAIRELDLLLDQFIPLIGWKIGYVFVVFAGVIAYTGRDVLKQQITRFVVSRAFAVLWAGFVISIPFSQLVGHGAFLEVLMGEDYVRTYKRIIEEVGEFTGYLLIAAGSLEAYAQK